MASDKRFYATLGIAAVVVVIGVLEYAVRHDNTGIIVAVIGVATGASAYARRRKS